MMKWKFSLNPVPASRPRISKWGAYYSGTYKEFRERAAEMVWNVLGNNFVPVSTPLAVSLELYVKRPKSTEKEFPKPDVDNYAKAILDSLNGKLWVDDSQIYSLYVTKQWAEKGEDGYFILEVSDNN